MSGYRGRGGGFVRSRGGDDSHDGGESVSIFLPTHDCGKIIGRGGTKIRELQDESGCTIIVYNDDEVNGTCRLELSGFDDAINKAMERIYHILDAGDDRGVGRQHQQSYGGRGDSKEIMQVDSRFVGRIIGKGGSRLRELQDQCGCRINVSRGGSYGKMDVELTGSNSQIQLAMDAIEDLMNSAF